MKKDTSWMLAFIEDLRDVAQDRNLAELAADLDRVAKRHGGALASRSEPDRCKETPKASNVIPFTSRRA